MGVIDGFLAELRPIVTALLALSFVLIWQIAGTAILTPLLRRTGIGKGWSLTLGWLLWLPVCGALGLVLSLSRLADVDVLRTVLVGIVAGASMIMWSARNEGWRPHREIIGILGRLPKPLVGVILLIQVLQLLFAAHPQRLYDQLSYHVVIAKLVVSYGHSYWPFYDPHLVIGSIIESAFVWPRAVLDSDFFALGVGQVWIYLVSVGTVFASTALVLKRFNPKYAAWILFAVLAAIPGLIPDNEIFAIAKPGAVIFAGSYLVMLFICLIPEQALPVTLVIGTSLLAINPTFAHVAVALGPVVVIGLVTRRMPLKFASAWWLVIGLSLGVLVVSVARSYILTGTFMFPTDARFVPTPFSDQLTQDYWQWVAFGSKEPFPARWLGALSVMWRSKTLGLWSGLGLVLIALYGRRSGGPLHGISLFLFLALYALVWPLFYDSHIFSRFVAGYTATLLASGVIASLVSKDRGSLAIVLIGIVGGVLCSSADVVVRKLFDWNQHTLYEDYAKIFPRMVSAHTVNSWSTRDDTVVTDESEKLFFTSKILSSTLSPPERVIWREILDKPQEAALRHRVTAVVMEDFPPGKEMPEEPAPFHVPIRGVFKALSPFGEVIRVRDDWVLKSPCYFQVNPCP
jgi:hypothetical protein